MDDELPGHRSGACLYYISYDDQGHAYNMYPDRLAQLAELSRSEFDPELFSHSAFVKLFCDIRDKSAVFNILRQNDTIFDKGNA